MGSTFLDQVFEPIERLITWVLLLSIGVALALIFSVVVFFVLLRLRKKRKQGGRSTFAVTFGLCVSGLVWGGALLYSLIPIYSQFMLFKVDTFSEHDRMVGPQLTVKVTGHQWYWEYEYPNQNGIKIESKLLGSASAGKTDTKGNFSASLVIPSETQVRLLMTSADVIHLWNLKAYNISIDAVPGRINEQWLYVPKNGEGIHLGQCIEFCGDGHPQMQIKVEVVSKKAFDTWIETAQSKR